MNALETALIISGGALLLGVQSSKPAITQPTQGQVIRVFAYPYNLQVKGTAITPLELHLYQGGEPTQTLMTATGNFTSTLSIEGPGPHELAWSGKDSAGNTITATINFTVQTQVVNSLADAIGVNINACVGFDPVLGQSEAAPAVAPDMNFVRTWVDRLVRDGIKYIRLTVAWESMYPLASKQNNVVQQIGNWADYCASKQIYMYPVFMTFPHHGLPSTSAASSTNMYARGFPRDVVQPFIPSSATNDAAFFQMLYTNQALWQRIFDEFWKPIIERIDDNQYVLGYEICNEPPFYPGQAPALGNFHTGIAEKIRTYSNKWIMFVDGFPQAGAGAGIGDYNQTISPRVNDIVFCPHNYAGINPVGWQARFTQRLNNFKATQQALACPAILDEFGIGLVGAPTTINTQDNMDHIFNELRRVGFGGMCWVYWPGATGGGGLHMMIQGNGTLTAYGQLYMNSRSKVYGY